MSVSKGTKRKDNLYEYKATIGTNAAGKKVRKSFYSSKSLRDAKAKAEQYKIDYEVRLAAGDAVPLNRITFEDAAQRILKYKKEKLKANTWELNWNNVINNHLIPYFKDTNLSKIIENDISDYFLSKKDLSRATLRKHLSCLQEIFKNALKNHYISSNPVEDYKLEFGTKSTKKDVYTPEQAERVLAYATTHRFGLGIILLLQYGMSVSELLGLMYGDVDFENKTIHIQRGVTLADHKVLISDTKNEYRNRVIAVNQATIDMIRSQEKKSEYIISNSRGTVCRPDNWRKRHYHVFMDEMHLHYFKSGIDIPVLNPHELRHTRASIWVNEGKNLYAIAAEMGWADLEMLRKRYAHGDIQKLREQLDL